MIICSYKNQEFIRIGYYVNNDYQEEELKLNPPECVIIDKIERNILSEKPRVTRVPIKWDNITEIEEPEENTPEESCFQEEMQLETTIDA